MEKRKIIILGSTGSLGTQTLEILDKYSEHFEVIGLSANIDEELLTKQAKNHNIPSGNTVLASRDGEEKVKELASHPEAEVVINVLPGLAGINPTIAALKAGKTVLLGNKESLVAEGKKTMCIVQKKNKTNKDSNCTVEKLLHSPLISIDSEHNAIFEILKHSQALAYESTATKSTTQSSAPTYHSALPHIRRITIPCSGGPFLNKSEKELEKLTAKDALAHPRWKMGEKVSIESATLINKGLEIIEAHYLFGLPLDKIDVVVHPECQVHGIVEFEETEKKVSPGKLFGPHLAYISPPNMREHIENALCHVAGIPSGECKKTPNKREIRPLKQNEFKFQKIPKHLPGISIVLSEFKKHPDKMTDFLKKEESLIRNFINGEIAFTEIFQNLT